MRLTNDKTVKDFIRHLQSEGKSLVSVKNYKSDLNHFLAWAILKIKSIGAYAESVMEMVPFISHSFFTDYKNYMVENKIKNKTVNRRLSTLRNFSHFLTTSQIIDGDFMQEIQNVGIGVSKNKDISSSVIDEFRISLTKSQSVSANTVKNYVADVSSFLDWVDKKGELPNGI